MPKKGKRKKTKKIKSLNKTKKVKIKNKGKKEVKN